MIRKERNANVKIHKYKIQNIVGFMVELVIHTFSLSTTIIILYINKLITMILQI